MMLDITVVIPLYNKAPHITRALDSALAQTITSFEVIVVDDGSTDGGAVAVASYFDSRIRMIRQSNMGVSAARNRGISEARTGFIAFLDADDEWHPEHLETLLRLRRKFPQAGICATAWIRIFKDERQDAPKYSGVPSPPWEGVIDDYFKSAALGDSPVWTSAVGIPIEVFKDVGLFRSGVNRGEDSEMWGRIAFSFPVAFSWDGPGYYRKNAVSSAVRMEPMQEQHPFLLSVRERYGDESKAPYFVRCYLNRKRMERTNNLIRYGKKEEAIEYFLSQSPFPCSIRSLRKTVYNFFRR